jgi:hypothetical protein
MSDQQQVRKAHMLVVSGDRQTLPPFAGVLKSIVGLFIVSREEDGRTVWLVSDDRSPLLHFVEDWLAYDTRWWLPKALASLRHVAPKCFGNPEKLQWGIYDAPKAEGRASGAIPTEERIEQFRFENLWAVWPTKLTLAPKASADLLAAFGLHRIVPSKATVAPAAWSAVRECPTIAEERWRKTSLVEWRRFEKQYL